MLFYRRPRDREPVRTRVARARRSALRVLVEDYGWIHLGIGLLGNAIFIGGGVMFLPGGDVTLPGLGHSVAWALVGRWFFIVGSSLMFVGNLGELIVSLYSRRRRRRRREAQA